MEEINSQRFWTSILILLNNYHSINRKLCACIIDNVVAISKGIELFKSTNKLEATDKYTIDKNTLMQHLKQQIQSGEQTDLEGIVVYFKCLPKKGQDSINSIGLLDFTTTTYRQTFDCDYIEGFDIKLEAEGGLDIQTLNSSTDIEVNNPWTEYVLKPKLLKWSRIGDSSSNLDTILANENSSLRLVDIEKYNKMYKEFKIKYSEKVLKFWQDAKESTDPLKFIYEDLAIASYLITLWQSDEISHSPRAFADLGCGNGLLVYILIEEGYHGYGYDIRCRKLWSLYPSKVAQQLIEQPVEPLKFQLPPDVDWLIGNHSDELSPWLPVLAAISNYRMSYFLLPCCAFEFSGNKFQRRNSNASAFKDFCAYTECISDRCGFFTEKDRLKIPSTKRIAFVGRRRKYSYSQQLQVVTDIKEFVRSEQKHYGHDGLDEIKLRNKEEAVRNCTQIDKTILNNLVMKIFQMLLSDPHAKSIWGENNEWNCGDSLRMSEIVQQLDKEDLVQIKSECGGLKTLLRNKHEIFELQNPDLVRIRNPQLRISQKINKLQTVKKRTCFFYENHPQGCPLSDEQCTFLH